MNPALESQPGRAPLRVPYSWNIADRLAWQAEKQPAAPAIISGETPMSYGQLNCRVSTLAAWFRAAGVGLGDRVCVVTENHLDVITSLLALARLGAVAVPTNWRLAEPELTYIAQHADAVGMVTQTKFLTTVRGVAAACGARFILDIEHDAAGDDIVTAIGDAIERHDGAVVPGVVAEEHDLQRIMYTSGTTSHPKGVMLSHGNVLWNCIAHTLEIGLGPHDVVMLAAPLFHVGGLDAVAMATLYAGGTVLIASSLAARDVAEAVQRHGVTSLGFMAAQTIADLARDGTDGFDMSTLRLVISGGNTPEVLSLIRNRYPKLRFAIGYGMTELTSGCSYSDYDTQDQPDKVMSAGRPFPFMTVRVVGDDDAEVDAGEVGELIWAGPKVCLGYWRDPEATAAAFTTDGWLRSGDLGLVDEAGRVFFVDRKKDMLKSGGENVASAEVEAALLKHRAVVDVAVIGVADERWDEVPKAFVVLRPGMDATFEELREHLLPLLAKFKIPKYIDFVDHLPRNESGKILKRQLRLPSAGIQTDQSV